MHEMLHNDAALGKVGLNKGRSERGAVTSQVNALYCVPHKKGSWEETSQRTEKQKNKGGDEKALPSLTTTWQNGWRHPTR